jgi:hypothetical protein
MIESDMDRLCAEIRQINPSASIVQSAQGKVFCDDASESNQNVYILRRFLGG